MNKQKESTDSDLGTLAEDARALMAATADVAGEKVSEARKRLAAAFGNVLGEATFELHQLNDTRRERRLSERADDLRLGVADAAGLIEYPHAEPLLICSINRLRDRSDGDQPKQHQPRAASHQRPPDFIF